MAGTVTDKKTGQSCTTDSDGFQSCTTYYDLRLSYGDRTEVRRVGSDTYDDVRRGDRAELDTWRDAVVSLAVRGHTHTYDPPADDSLRWRLSAAWVILGVALWAAAGGRPVYLVNSVRWIMLSLAISTLVYSALFGASVWQWIFGAAFALFCIAFLLVDVDLTRQPDWVRRRRRGPSWPLRQK
ncbi:hypothetical protein ACFTTN_03575 [Streptomyces niveus]|uniref:hypothetical protein n=1 Tax=Streptomyces niveus TaxID=193462 RepID=UPI00363F94AC